VARRRRRGGEPEKRLLAIVDGFRWFIHGDRTADLGQCFSIIRNGVSGFENRLSWTRNANSEHCHSTSNRASTPPYEVQNQGDYGENNQKVDESPGDVERYPREQPSDK
jgi:hypothetical protein